MKTRPSNVVPLPYRPDALVPVELPTFSNESWMEKIISARLAKVVLEKTRSELTEAADKLAKDPDGNGRKDHLSGFMHDLIADRDYLRAVAEAIDTAAIRLAVVSEREDEYLALQSDNDKGGLD